MAFIPVGFLVWSAFVLAVAATSLVIGYYAYQARIAREATARNPKAPTGADPIHALAALRRETETELHESRARAASVRDAFAKGLR